LAKVGEGEVVDPINVAGNALAVDPMEPGFGPVFVMLKGTPAGVVLVLVPVRDAKVVDPVDDVGAGVIDVPTEAGSFAPACFVVSGVPAGVGLVLLPAPVLDNERALLIGDEAAAVVDVPPLPAFASENLLWIPDVPAGVPEDPAAPLFDKDRRLAIAVWPLRPDELAVDSPGVVELEDTGARWDFVLATAVPVVCSDEFIPFVCCLPE
jgi:hypothetical protein